MNDPNWENKYELLDYVMSFLETAEDLNDVLAGYFSKLINMLTNKWADQFIPYLYENEERLMKFAEHSYSKSISEDLANILRQDVPQSELIPNELIEQRREAVVRALIENLKTENEMRLEEYCLNVAQLFQDWALNWQIYPHLSSEWVIDQLIGLAKQEGPRGIAALWILKTLILHLRSHVVFQINKNAKETNKENAAEEGMSSIMLGEEEEE